MVFFIYGFGVPRVRSALAVQLLLWAGSGAKRPLPLGGLEPGGEVRRPRGGPGGGQRAQLVCQLGRWGGYSPCGGYSPWVQPVGWVQPVRADHDVDLSRRAAIRGHMSKRAAMLVTVTTGPPHPLACLVQLEHTSPGDPHRWHPMPPPTGNTSRAAASRRENGGTVARKRGASRPG